MLESPEYVPPAAYVAEVAVELVDQPWKIYPVLVGVEVDKVLLAPCALYWVDGTVPPVYPFPLYEMEYRS